ncbi:XVIPCD domain-containing protein [Dyella koreensis]|uniref:Peptidoglycan-binding protein n=1 Tax=Dyella koreensis TaxID=311235 RepID=A0ABW8JZQ0_9GAMM
MTNTTITADQLRTVLFATENSNNEDVLTKFSWAGNESSSYSFGILQFDVARDHGYVKQFLTSHGFTSEQIKALSTQGGGLTQAELEPLDAQLRAIPKEDLNEFTNKNLGKAVARVDDLVGSLRSTNPAVADAIASSDELQLAIADYDNQFHIDGIGGKAPSNSMLAYLEGQSVKMPGGTLQLGDTISRSDLQEFINATGYAKNHERAVAGREERLNGALADLKLIDPSTVAQSHTAGHGSLKLGARGDAVGDLQTRLGELGYTDPRGNPLVADKHFGPTTKAAVEAFQRDHGLTADGAAGPATQKAIEEQIQARAQANTSTQTWQCPLRLDDPTHPDNAFYLRTRDLVHQLDQQNGRVPDQRSDQLASALTVQARTDGLQRIDQIALSEDASALWGAQRPPGVRDHFFDQFCNVNTVQALNTPMEQSGAQWPQAMQQFQQHHEQAQQQQQQQQDQTVQQSSAAMQMR